jgi:hypothetical protein
MQVIVGTAGQGIVSTNANIQKTKFLYLCRTNKRQVLLLPSTVLIMVQQSLSAQTIFIAYPQLCAHAHAHTKEKKNMA